LVRLVDEVVAALARLVTPAVTRLAAAAVLLAILPAVVRAMMAPLYV
jgi:hypothetical protein